MVSYEGDQTLVYLRDFDHWFGQLPLRVPGLSIQACEAIRAEMLSALETHCDVVSHELKDLRALTRQTRSPDEFIITLDGGTYFHEYDFSFAMTRAVTRVSDALGGRTIRVAREGSGQFWTQVDALRDVYQASGKTSIVVCDDGIDTGRSLAEVMQQLAGQYLTADRIRVLMNPHQLTNVAGVDVTALLSSPGALWTHERDFFWGSPGGGVSMCDKRNINVLYGVPYSLSCELLANRLGLDGDLRELRRQVLELNRDFWSLVSTAAGRQLRLKDCPRLLWARDIGLVHSDLTLIADLLSDLLATEPALGAL